jgi:hypothetical protein
MKEFIQLGDREIEPFGRLYDTPAACFDEYNEYYVRLNKSALEAIGLKGGGSYYSTARLSPEDMTIAFRIVQADNPPGKTYKKIAFLNPPTSARLSVSGLKEALGGKMPIPGYYPLLFGEDGVIYMPISPADRLGDKAPQPKGTKYRKKVGEMSTKQLIELIKREVNK